MTIQHQQPQHPDRAPVSQPVPEGMRDDVCQALAGILGEGVDVHRCLAAKALGRIGGEGAAQPLIAALLDEDEDVRTDAAEALAGLADPRAGQQLLENLLGDPCADVKLAAIEALAKMRDGQVIPWLRRLVKGRDEEIVWDEDEFYSSGWDDWMDIQIKAVNALADMNVDGAVPDIVAAIWGEDAQDMTEAAFRALARMGKPGIAALARILDEDSIRLRRRAAAALAGAEAGDAAGDTMEPVSRAVKDPAADVRRAALQALAARLPADDRLAGLIDDPDAVLRAEAVRLCGAHHPDRLLARVDDTVDAVRVAALETLASLEEVSAKDALIPLLQSGLGAENDAVAAAAARALAAVDPSAATDGLTGLLADDKRAPQARLGALQGLASIGGDRAVAALVNVIDDEARSIRLEAMSALARLARADMAWPNPAGEALLSALQGGYTPENLEQDEAQADATPAVQAEEITEPAPEILAQADNVVAFPTSTLNAILSDTPEAREVVSLPDEGVELTPMDMERLALAKRIKGKKRMSVEPKVVLHEDIRRFAARVLGDLYQVEVAQALVAVLSVPDGELRMAAADSLARIGEGLTPLPGAVADALIAAQATASRDEKILLLRAMGACDGEDAADLLTAHLADADPFLRAEAVRALAKLRRVGAEIGNLLNDSDPAVRLCAAEAIAGTSEGSAVGPLVDFAFSFEGYHGRQAARLLRGLDASRASALFMAVLQDAERKWIWSVAIEALEELNRS